MGTTGPRTRPDRPPHLPALDGLRALAVTAVLLEHGGVGGLPGGFLGVTVFFTLSGFLITGLLVAERQRGRVNLRAFWVRRARRLVPAALVTTALVALLAGTGALRPPRGTVGDGAAALGWVVNWRYVRDGRSYADAFTDPSPFQHFWSLSVEEQVYLVVPFTVVAVLGARLRPRSRWRTPTLLALLVAGVVASTTACWVLHPAGAPVLRSYYGTDARLAEPLVGAVLAVLVVRGGGPVRLPRAARRLADLAAVAALAGLGLLVTRLGAADDRLYRGGFLLTAVLTAVVLLALSQPASALGRLLSLPPLAAVGRVSYGALPLPLAGLPLARPGGDRAVRGAAARAAAGRHRGARGDLLLAVELPVRARAPPPARRPARLGERDRRRRGGARVVVPAAGPSSGDLGGAAAGSRGLAAGRPAALPPPPGSVAVRLLLGARDRVAADRERPAGRPRRPAGHRTSRPPRWPRPPGRPRRRGRDPPEPSRPSAPAGPRRAARPPPRPRPGPTGGAPDPATGTDRGRGRLDRRQRRRGAGRVGPRDRPGRRLRRVDPRLPAHPRRRTAACRGDPDPVAEQCGWWDRPDSERARALAAFAPDVVVVHAGYNELPDRRPAGWPTFSRPATRRSPAGSARSTARWTACSSRTAPGRST